MHQDVASSTSFLEALVKRQDILEQVDVGIFPPFPLLGLFQQKLANTGFLFGGQNMHWEEKGAFTGEVSGHLLKAFGTTHVILGHSERRQIFKETDDVINKKVLKAQSLDLCPILCVGETLEERENGKAQDVVEHQLHEGLRYAAATKTYIYEGKEGPTHSLLDIAYEPVWAIGTGKVATPAQVSEMHQFIKNWLSKRFPHSSTRVLYGGSVKPDNVAGLMAQPGVDGALIGGASLEFSSFERIFDQGKTP